MLESPTDLGRLRCRMSRIIAFIKNLFCRKRRDPLLDVIGIIDDGRLSSAIDAELYGKGLY